MPKHFITVLGVLVMILPLTGLPWKYKGIAIFLLGLAIALASYFSTRKRSQNGSGKRASAGDIYPPQSNNTYNRHDGEETKKAI